MVEFFEQAIPGTVVSFWMRRVPRMDVFLGETEVTWDLYDIFVYGLDLSPSEQAAGLDAESRPSKPYGSPDQGFGHAGFPALGVHVHAAIEFCAWLSGRTGTLFRLPTVEEWTCAAGSAQAKGLRLREDATHACASRMANENGFFDMYDNVSEWALGDEPVVCGGNYLSPGLPEPVPFDPRWQETDPQFPKSRWWLADTPWVGLRIAADL
jgi:hypothetical protein